MLVLALGAGLLVGPAARAADEPDPRPGDPAATLTVTELRPHVLTEDGTVQVLGTLTNDGRVPLTALEVDVRVGARVDSRSLLRGQDDSPPSSTRRARVQLASDLAPGQTQDVDLRVAVDDLGLRGDGVYPLVLDVRGSALSSGGPAAPEQVATVRTDLPWFGAVGDLDPLRIAWVVPLVDRPRVSPDGVFLDDELATSLAPDGRLGRLLAGARAGGAGRCAPPADPLLDPGAGPGQAPGGDPAAGTVRRPVSVDPSAPLPPCDTVPVTYAVDPDLLSAAQMMTGDYQVVVDGTTTRAGTGQQAAVAWLASLREAVRQAGVIALPYADVDATAMSRNGLTAQIATARDVGRRVVTDVLSTDPLATVALPPPGPVSDAALAALTTPATRAVVLDPSALVADVSPTTRGARTSLPSTASSGPLTGLVTDAGLSTLLHEPGPAALVAQRFLVEAAATAFETPSIGRTLLVVPERRADLDPDVLSAAIRQTGQVPWACGVSLAQVVAGDESCPGKPVPVHGIDREGELVQPYPKRDLGDSGSRLDGLGQVVVTPQLLPAAQVERAAVVDRRIEQFTEAVLLGGTQASQDLRDRYDRAVLRTLSTSWREDVAPGVRLAGLLSEAVDGLYAGISLSTQPVTLTSRASRLDYSITNRLDQPVTVQVRFTHPRLVTAPSQVLTVPGGSQVPYSVDTEALTSGRFIVSAQLEDRNGTPIAAAQDFSVRSTRYGSLALGVTGIAAAVLLVAAGVRITRRAMLSRAAGRAA